jgi:hypothetical protein
VFCVPPSPFNAFIPASNTCLRRLSSAHPHSFVRPLDSRPQRTPETDFVSPVAGIRVVSLHHHARVSACVPLASNSQVCSGAEEYLPLLPGVRLPGSQTSGGLLSGLDALDLDIPVVPGYAIAGTVDAIGAAVAHLKPGDPVVGTPYRFALVLFGSSHATTPSRSCGRPLMIFELDIRKLVEQFSTRHAC